MEFPAFESKGRRVSNHSAAPAEFTDLPFSATAAPGHRPFRVLPVLSSRTGRGKDKHVGSVLNRWLVGSSYQSVGTPAVALAC